MDEATKRSIVEKFKAGEDVSSALGKPLKIETNTRVTDATGYSQSEADMKITYADDIIVFINHDFSTVGRKIHGGRIYAHHPTSYTDFSATLRIPRAVGGDSYYDKYYFGRKHRYIKSENAADGARSMMRHIKKTLGLNVEISRFGGAKIAEGVPKLLQTKRGFRYCGICGDEVPETEMFQHVSAKHQEVFSRQRDYRRIFSKTPRGVDYV